MSQYSIYDILISHLTVNQHRDLHDVKLELTGWCVSLYVPNSNDIKHYSVKTKLNHDANYKVIWSIDRSWRSDASSNNITHHSNLHAACKLAPTRAPCDGRQFSHQLERVEEIIDKIQNEKELLAIIWSCHKFDQYIYGRDVVHIDSDHELLQAVFKKPIHQSPKCLQRMRMALQNYSLDIRYKKGHLMFIADALSCSYRLMTDDAKHESSAVHALREVHHTDGLSVSPKRLEEFKLHTVQDPEMQLLTSQIQKGWPTSRKECQRVNFSTYLPILSKRSFIHNSP